MIEGKNTTPDRSIDLDESDQLWRDRGAYWESVTESQSRSSRPDTSIAVAGHGALLRIDGNTLVIRHGYTHHPQERREDRYRPRDPRLAPRIVLMNCDGAVSISALAWLAQQQVPIVLLDWRGNLIGSFSADYGTGDNSLRRALERLTYDESLALARSIIREKLVQQVATVSLFPASPSQALTVGHIERECGVLQSANSVEEIRIIEARAALAYFRLWARLPMHWKGLGRRPVPVEWFRVGMRGSAIGEGNRRATLPAQAMINYAYSVLLSRVAIACAKIGLDTTIGIIHATRKRRISLVLDLMEPLRPITDAALLHFIGQNTFDRADFTVEDSGVTRLHPQLARAVCALSVPEVMIDSTLKAFIDQLRGRSPKIRI